MDPLRRKVAKLFREAADFHYALETHDTQRAIGAGQPAIARILGLRGLSDDAGRRRLVAASQGEVAAAQRHLDESFRLRLWASSELTDPNTRAATLAEAYCRGQGVARIRQETATRLDGIKTPKLFAFARWVLALTDPESRGQSDRIENPFGVSSDVIPETFLASMCDWHLTEGTSEKNYAPFLFGAFPLLPVEVRLWNKVRGEGTVSSFGSQSHPLLQTTVAALSLEPVDPLPADHAVLAVASERILAEGLATREWLTSAQEEYQAYHRRVVATGASK
jgi:hypothetical protein